jgi:hypothetical protein
VLKRNYDSLSLFHAKDSAEFQRLKGLTDEQKRQIEDLLRVQTKHDEVVKQMRQD